MDRLVLLAVFCGSLVGCQSSTTGFDPFAVGRPTRVPPPPTGVVNRQGQGVPGNAGASYQDRTPQTWPASDYGYQEAERYWDEDGHDSMASLARSDSTTSGQRQGSLQRNERLEWRDPGFRETLPTYSEFRNQSPIGSGSIASRSAPRPLSRPAFATPIGSPRVRGFTNTDGQQSLGIPPELAAFRNDGIRQASAFSRYDDVRR